jgi:hypothetical protein
MFEESSAKTDILSNEDRLIGLVDKILLDIIKETSVLSKGSSVFHCKEAPTISISLYLKSNR